MGGKHLSHELVSWFMTNWILDPNGVSQILLSGNLELGLGEETVKSLTGKLGVGRFHPVTKWTEEGWGERKDCLFPGGFLHSSMKFPGSL